MRAKLQLPAGPLRRFRLPPGIVRSGAPAHGRRKRAWALVPFGLFALLTYWLSAGRPLPDLRHWLDGPPRADRGGGGTLRSEAPRLEAAALQPNPPPVEEPTAEAPPATPAEREAQSEKPQKRKPPLVLQRHRLRPVLGWEEPAGDREPSRSVRR